MHVCEILSKTNKTLFSFEILPPLKGGSFNDIFNSIEPLLEFKPAYINVTYHQEEVVYKDRGNGLVDEADAFERHAAGGFRGATRGGVCRVL